jgi:predicted RNA-binding Zn-ribbon protein involved in translation (DUF1610 family)
MKKYNIPDVVSTEELYLRLRPWIVGHPNLAVYNEAGEVVQCPKCGSHDIRREGEWHTQVNTYPRFQCHDCGGWSRGRYTTTSTERRKLLLVN